MKQKLLRITNLSILSFSESIFPLDYLFYLHPMRVQFPVRRIVYVSGLKALGLHSVRLTMPPTPHSGTFLRLLLDLSQN